MKKFTYADLFTDKYYADSKSKKVIKDCDIKKIDMFMNEQGDIHTEGGVWVANVNKIIEEDTTSWADENI